MYRVQNIGTRVSPPRPQPTSSWQCQDQGHHTLVPLPTALPVLCLNREPGHLGDPLGQKECPPAPCLCTIGCVNHAGQAPAGGRRVVSLGLSDGARTCSASARKFLGVDTFGPRVCVQNDARVTGPLSRPRHSASKLGPWPVQSVKWGPR